MIDALSLFLATVAVGYILGRWVGAARAGRKRRHDP
jgi:hypothetical protein